MMNFFEKELRKLFENHPALEDVRFTGRICMARLTDTTNVKLKFVTMGYADHYSAIEATILNRNEGKVDNNVFRFADILGTKKVSNPNFPQGISPHIAQYGNDIDWYVYKPTPADYEEIRDVLGEYLEMFQAPVQTQGMSQGYRTKKPYISKSQIFLHIMPCKMLKSR
jgi:hypothetical protein